MCVPSTAWGNRGGSEVTLQPPGPGGLTADRTQALAA